MRGVERHDLVTLRADWPRFAGALPDEAARQISLWQAAGHPFVVASRRHGDDEGGVRLGLAGPGKTRLSFVTATAALASHQPPPQLAEMALACPPDWQPMLARLTALADEFDLTLRAFGSAMWQALTGQAYLSATSDLDLLIEPATSARREAGLAALAALKTPVRLDGEIRLAGWGDVAWREWLGGAERVLLKTRQGPRLIARREAA
jgi:phosphoribosyl-dephospho-CoA transferase